MRENHLKRLLKEGSPAYGIWLSSGSAAVAEAVSHLETDWILFDSEHGVASYEACFPLLQAVAGGSASSIVRVPSTDPAPVRRVLDMGAEGVLVPFIRTVEEVERVVAACRYPPQGIRGIGPYRASRYYLDFADYFGRANQEVLVTVQIETTEALDNLEAILAVPGLDAVFIGPADLSAALGQFPNIGAPEVKEAIQRIVSAADRAEMPVGFYCNSGGEARERVAQGCRMVSVAIDLGVLTRGLRRELREARGDRPASKR
jgi:4-hydroxy-2-oxoheptanedioate aldolase